jgi:hypothetical protein
MYKQSEDFVFENITVSWVYPLKTFMWLW